MSKSNRKGWVHTDYDFDEIYDFGFNIHFEYQGRVYHISCEDDQALYDDETNEVLWRFNSKEEFYSGIIFGRPIQEVMDDSYMMGLS